MDDGDDDLYGGNDGGVETTMDGANDTGGPAQAKDVKMEGGDDEESGDSDDDIQITLEKPDGSKAEPPNKRSASFAKPSRNPAAAAATSDRASKTPAAGIKQENLPRRASSTVQPAPTPQPTSTSKPANPLTHAGKEGKDYPAVRTSRLSVDANPVFPGANKPITALDIDADLAQHSKPWRLPGTDQTDFFNYGFDEYTWTQYCIRQQTMASGIAEQKRQDEGLKAMLGGGGGGGPGGPGGAAGGMGMGGMGGGMPEMPPEMMQQMMAMMGGGGMDPSQMDMGQMQQFMQGGPPPGGMGGGGNMGGNQRGGMGGGMGRGGGSNSGQSPMPQQGQGFQPPSGPGGGAAPFDPQALMQQGFSPQQIEMMRPQGGGRGGRGGRRGGRGYY